MTEHKQFIISEQCWHIMQQFAGLAYDKDKNEISGLLHVRKGVHPVDGEPVYELFDPIILEQENTGTTTELDGDAIRDYTIKAGMKYGKDIKFCWLHSHHTMGAFWSGTDRNEIEAWKNDSWSISLVVNLKQEYKLNISVWDPVEVSEDVPLEIIRAVPQPTAKQKKEYEKLCSTAKPTVISNYRGYKPNTGWVHNTVNTNQTSFITQSALTLEDKFEWKNDDTISPYAELIEEVDDRIEEIIDATMQGELLYKDYSEAIDELNKQLKTRNARIKVIKIDEGKVLQKAACMQTWEHIEYHNEDTEKIYDNARTAQYNHTWGWGGNA